jgi:glycosyltransferase involved in cell wall biosynthesis
MRVLYLQASWIPPSENTQADRFFLLSEYLEGDVLQPIWFERPDQVETEFGAGTYPEYTRARFRYHWFLAFQHNGWRRRFSWLWFYLRNGLALHRKHRFDCIVVYSHMMPALAGVVLKLLTGAKLIVEIMTAPELSYLYENRRRTLGDRASRLFSHCSLYITVLMSDRVHLLYDSQLSHFPLLRRVAASVFHDFVVLANVRPAEPRDRERVVLLVGAPWFLKGADLLVRAFRDIAEDFPDITVKIQGHYPDKDELEELIAGFPRIEIVKAVPNPETLRRISRALVLVHPSRCDGLSRVLIEAMGSAVPIIASDAGGNPHCIRDGETGLVFPSGDADTLSKRLRELLSDEEKRERLARKGHERAWTQYTEKVYVDQFTKMIYLAVTGHERQEDGAAPQ